MSRKGIYYTLFFVALFTVFYLTVYKWIKPSNTVISEVQPFSFVNQDGQAFTNKDMAGKVCVVEFFFTTCTGICPQMNSNMKRVYEKFKDKKDFLIVSHTCKPEEDSVMALKKYAEKLNVDTRRWVFLTGRKDSLYDMARVSYTVDDPVNNLRDINEDFLHTQFWALVDKEGKVKKVYDGLKDSEIELLIKRVNKLVE